MGTMYFDIDHLPGIEVIHNLSEDEKVCREDGHAEELYNMSADMFEK